jgi:hypothetical protein
MAPIGANRPAADRSDRCPVLTQVGCHDITPRKRAHARNVRARHRRQFARTWQITLRAIVGSARVSSKRRRASDQGGMRLRLAGETHRVRTRVSSGRPDAARHRAGSIVALGFWPAVPLTDDGRDVRGIFANTAILNRPSARTGGRRRTPGPCRARWRDFRVRITDERRHEPPVRPAIDAHSDPASVTDVRRNEEPSRIGPDQHLLDAERGGEPDGKAIRAVVVIIELREQPATDAPRGFPPRCLFRRIRQAQADRAQPIHGRARQSPGARAARRPFAAHHRLTPAACAAPSNYPRLCHIGSVHRVSTV